jgi:hypothetical protein
VGVFEEPHDLVGVGEVDPDGLRPSPMIMKVPGCYGDPNLS